MRWTTMSRRWTARRVLIVVLPPLTAVAFGRFIIGPLFEHSMWLGVLSAVAFIVVYATYVIRTTLKQEREARQRIDNIHRYGGSR
jgi:uncharacterized membrane protein